MESPDFFKHQHYLVDRIAGYSRGENGVDYQRRDDDDYYRRIERITVDNDEVFAFGDNTHSSYDSRYWGGIPLENIRGRAFFRYVPLDQMKFLR